MSIRATDYALHILEDDKQLGTPARAVFLALAIRANSRSATTFTGGWLCKVTNLHEDNVSRHMKSIVAAGYVTVDHRPGQANVVHFPVVPYLAGADEVIHTPREIAGGAEVRTDVHPPRNRGGTPREIAGAPPAKSRGVSGSVSGSVSGVPALCDTAGCECDSSGWIYDDTTRTVTPCTNRRTA